jgi:hypothetical protein
MIRLFCGGALLGFTFAYLAGISANPLQLAIAGVAGAALAIGAPLPRRIP